MSDVPPEVLTKILSCLPVKSLLRFRSVSKSLRALIDSPYFVNLHLEQSMKTDKILAYVSGVDSSTSFRSLNLDSHPTAVELETPFNRTCFPFVLGSCHGLICLRSGLFERLILLWNPSTRKYKLIPNPVDYPPTCSILNVVDQVCYDHVNNDYKVVRLTQTCATGFWLESRFFVYSLKLNVWLPVEQKFPYNDLLGYFKNQGVCVSGAIHWLLNQLPDPDKDYLMVSFDLASQTFHSVPQPEYFKNYTDADLGALGGCLCVAGTDDNRYNVDVWVMGEYGVKESWRKLVALTSTDMTSLLPHVRPIMYLKNRKEVVLEINHQGFVICDLEQNILREVRFSNVSCMSTFVYHESLV